MKKMLWTLLVGIFVPALAGATTLNLPAQPLSTSLQEVSRANGVLIVFGPFAVQGRAAPALNGAYTVEAALDNLLKDTDLTYHVLNDSVIEISPKPMDEVEINGRFDKLSAMRREYGRLETQFYSEYNKLNTDHQWDVNCSDDAPTGSRMTQHLCIPRFYDRATEGEAQAMLWGHFASPAQLIYLEKRAAFQKNLSEKIRQNPKLVELLMKQNAVAQRYEVARTKKSEGGKFLVWD